MAKRASGGVVAAVRAVVLPVIEGLGYTVWDIEYVKEGANMHLRITIDKPYGSPSDSSDDILDGITIDDCEIVHRAIDSVLDEADPIEDAYYLEVSSPGIERELRTDEHFDACVGAEVEIRLYAPVDGAKIWTGELLSRASDGAVRLLVGDSEKCFPRAAVAAVKTVFRFED